MLRYALRRIAYSFLILAGVLLLTFLLFRVAAGDPASTVLGKNPTPLELEEMRLRLGSCKPLLFGAWSRSEVCSGADFRGGRLQFPGITPGKTCRPSPQGIVIPPGECISFQKNFPVPEKEIRAEYVLSGTKTEHVQSPEKAFVLRNDTSLEQVLSEICFYRPSAHWYDSQFLDSLREIVSFSSVYPYVHFFQFGETLLTREPIGEVLLRGMAASLLLMIPVFLGELLAGIVLAMISAVFRGRWPDKLILVLSVAGMSISYLVLILFAQWYFGYYLNWFPVWGWGEIRFLWLPVLVGIVSGTGSGVRFYRTVFLNEMNREYLRTAAAKGCSPAVVCFRHLLGNAMIPIITRASAVLPFLFTGSLLLESFFGIPGLGFKGVDALNSSDLQTLKALVIVGAFLFVVINLIADLLYAWADPRIRLK